jgi:hypothetical protein
MPSVSRTQPRPPQLAGPEKAAAPRVSTLLLLLAGIIFCTHGIILTNSFSLCDDGSLVHAREEMLHPTWSSLAQLWLAPDNELYVPVTNTVWMATSILAKRASPDQDGIWLDAWYFHLASLFGHSIAALLVMTALQQLGVKRWPACIAAIFWAVHPLQVETVAWVASTKELLAGIFSLACISLYLAGADREKQGRPWLGPYCLGFTALCLALLSNPIAVTTPIVIAAIDLLLLRRPIRRVVLGVAPLLLPAVVVGMITRYAQDPLLTAVVPLHWRPLVAGDALVFYLRQIVMPIYLSTDYGHTPDRIIGDGTIYWAWLVLVVLAGVVWAKVRSRRYLCGIAIFAICLAPVLGLVPFEFQRFSTTADRYTYVALFGVAMILATALQQFWRRTLGWCAAGVLLVFAGRSMLQCYIWHDDVALWTNAAEQGGTLAAGNLAAAYQFLGPPGYAKAEEYLRAGIARDPMSIEAHDRYAILLLKQNRTAEAIDQMKRTVELEEIRRIPLHDAMANNRVVLGQFLLRQGRAAEAEVYFRKAMAIVPGHPDAMKGLHDLETRHPPATRSTSPAARANQ